MSGFESVNNMTAVIYHVIYMSVNKVTTKEIKFQLP